MNISKEEVNSLALKVTDLIMKDWDLFNGDKTRRNLVEETLYSSMEEFLDKFFEYPDYRNWN